jgi:hypothetical protein
MRKHTRTHSRPPSAHAILVVKHLQQVLAAVQAAPSPARQQLGDLCPSVPVHLVCLQQDPVLFLTEGLCLDIVPQLIHPSQPAALAVTARKVLCYD